MFQFSITRLAWSTVRLSNKQAMHSIKTMRWRPSCGSVLSVGCSDGICLWELIHTDFRQYDGRQTFPSRDCRPWMDFLLYEKHSPIVAMSWSPSGRLEKAHFIINAVRWLATVAASANSLVIWDVATKTGSRVYSFLHAEAELSSLEWSTNEKYLVTLCRFLFCVTHTYLF